MENRTTYKQKQQRLKGRPRGRPWLPGQSGNSGGRPPGSLNKITMAVLQGARRAEEELNRPIMLDQSRHYECWSDFYVQDGMRFRKDNLQRVNPHGPIPVRPVRLNVREIRQEVVWNGRRYWSQFGWLFDTHSHLPLKL
jgi:hypothetical protein